MSATPEQDVQVRATLPHRPSPRPSPRRRPLIAVQPIYLDPQDPAAIPPDQPGPERENEHLPGSEPVREPLVTTEPKQVPEPELSPFERLGQRSTELAELARPAVATGPTYASARSNRTVTVRANLLPREVLLRRDVIRTNKRVRRGLGALLGLLVAGYGLSWWQTHTADIDLHDINGAISAQQSQLDSYSPLITAQNGVAGIQTQLRSLMAGDLQWSQLTGKIRQAAPNGVQITGLSGALNTGSNQSGGLSSLNTTGKRPVGTLTITGTAPDKAQVGTYIASLTAITGLASPYPANVSNQQGTYSFSLNALITSDALGGRYTAPSTTAGK